MIKDRTWDREVTFLFSAITPKMKDRTPKVATTKDISFIVTAILLLQETQVGKI